MSDSSPQNPDPSQADLPGSGQVESVYGDPADEFAAGADVQSDDRLGWQLAASGSYAGDEQDLATALRECLAGYGCETANLTISTGDVIDVSMPADRA